MTTFGSFSAYQVEKWLSDLNNTYAALHFDNPEVAGAYMSEISGGSYKRCKAQFTAPDNRSTWNSNDLAWTGLPGNVKLAFIAIWDAQVNGNYICSAPLDAVTRVAAGSSFRYAAGELALSFA